MHILDERQAFRSLLRSDFKSFCRKVFCEVSPGNPYLDNWHIDMICDYLESVRNGKLNRLIVNLPPRYMKSIICSVALPAFLLGHNPHERILCVSYSDDLSSKMASDCRRVIESEWYKGVFPRTYISPTRRGVCDFETTVGGGRFSTSVGGVITGRGGNWIIIDDPIKPADAFSETIREKTNEWYGSTLLSRLDDKKSGKIILIMQRVHLHDLTGYLLEVDPSFQQVCLPLIAKENEEWRVSDSCGRVRIFRRSIGELLHPQRESSREVAAIKNTVGSFVFASQYQQTPAEAGVGLIKPEWLKTYNLEQLRNDVRFGRKKVTLAQSWDTASKAGEENDYSACITYARDIDKKIYILDVYRARLEFPDLVREAKRLAVECKQKYFDLNPYGADILVEEMNSGIGLAQELQRAGCGRVKPIHPERDKQTRLKSVSHLLENGSCLFPANKPVWWEAFERELLLFPNGKHDDQCDALSQLLVYEHLERPDLSWLKHI